MLLRQHGADVTVTGTDRLLAACQDADRAKVERLLAADPGLPGRIPAAQQAAATIHAAESGNTAAITLLLDLGFPVDASGDDGGTPLHAAAYSGSAPRGPVLAECRESALSGRHLLGTIVGGMMPDERRREWRTRIPRQGNHTRAGLRAELLP